MLASTKKVQIFHRRTVLYYSLVADKRQRKTSTFIAALLRRRAEEVEVIYSLEEGVDEETEENKKKKDKIWKHDSMFPSPEDSTLHPKLCVKQSSSRPREGQFKPLTHIRDVVSEVFLYWLQECSSFRKICSPKQG